MSFPLSLSLLPLSASFPISVEYTQPFPFPVIGFAVAITLFMCGICIAIFVPELGLGIVFAGFGFGVIGLVVGLVQGEGLAEDALVSSGKVDDVIAVGSAMEGRGKSAHNVSFRLAGQDSFQPGFMLNSCTSFTSCKVELYPRSSLFDPALCEVPTKCVSPSLTPTSTPTPTPTSTPTPTPVQ